MNTVEQNYHDLLREIQTACDEAKRSRREVILVAVSKGHEFSEIKKVYDCGQRDFGESYAQELGQKIARAKSSGLHDIRWHFIGAIQSNKINIIKDAQVVQSISSVRHAKLLDGAAQQTIEIFLQVKLDDNPKRQGVGKEALISTISQIQSLPMLNLQGLMTVLPLDQNSPSFWFSQMANLRSEILRQGLLHRVMLSMGMSDDFFEAIAHGANFIRIGTRIFGPRR